MNLRSHFFTVALALAFTPSVFSQNTKSSTADSRSICSSLSQRVQAHVFLAPAGRNASVSRSQFMVVCVDGAITSAGLVSSGRGTGPGSWERIQDISVNTDPGEYSVIDYSGGGKSGFYNDAFPNLRPRFAAVFKRTRSRDIVGRLGAGVVLKASLKADLRANDYQFDQGIHTNMEVTGAPASHGCVRANDGPASAFVNGFLSAGGPASARIKIHGSGPMQRQLSSSDVQSAQAFL